MFYLIKVISYFVVADCIHMYTLLNRNDLIGSLVYNDNVWKSRPIICVVDWKTRNYTLFFTQVLIVNYRLDFMDSHKLYLSIETCFRIVQCGFTQPLKATLFLNGWQPIWLIRVTKFFVNLIAHYTSIGPYTEKVDEHWLSKEIVCSVPVHLDLTVNFGIAVFIVMCNASR